MQNPIKSGLNNTSFLSYWKSVWLGINPTRQNLPVYSAAEKEQNEQEINALLCFLQKNRDSLKRAVPTDPILQRVKDRIKQSLGLSDIESSILYRQAYFDLSKQFNARAKAYDAELSTANIFQAIRNVWTMFILQTLFEKPVSLTLSVFAFSLLYPYSDNYIDHPDIRPDEKQRFNNRFKQRLKGKPVYPETDIEIKVFGLIQMIEQEYDRDSYPHIYHYMLSLLYAQEKSIELMTGCADPDNLDICIEKGGLSVLCDGLLVNGKLTNDQMSVFYGLGFLLQLVDDLRDIQTDTNDGVETVMVSKANSDVLDEMVNKMFNLSKFICHHLGKLNYKHSEALCSLVEKSIRLLLFDIMSETETYYSGIYFENIQKHCPVSFGSFKVLKEKLQELNPERKVNLYIDLKV